MDFEIDKNLKEKMLERVQHNIFGYEVQHNEYIQSIKYWHKKKY